MRRALTSAVGVVALVALAGPSGAANEVTADGSTLRIALPVEASGAMDTTEAVAALERQAAALARERLYGCFAIQPVFEDAAGGEDPHRVVVLPQRPGQFLRATGAGSPDPYAGGRVLYVGEQSLVPDAALDGPVGMLLAQDDSEVTGGLPGLIDYVIRHTDTTYQLKVCRWSGSLEITAVYDTYHLTVTSTIEFSFTVDATGFVDGQVAEATRSATADDPEVGQCSGSGLELFRVGLTGFGRNDGFVLRFSPKGMEPDFSLSCSRGRVDIGGDYIRAAFLPTGRLEYELNARTGATGTHSSTLQGRKVTAKVTLRRG